MSPAIIHKDRQCKKKKKKNDSDCRVSTVKMMVFPLWKQTSIGSERLNCLVILNQISILTLIYFSKNLNEGRNV
ncbi:hypothetical protein CDL15_Pgr009284 [Punica granatum]|uniref:Uncharacterized protein n=1 Tax=Punica granatum TaxID=22663 RepID=A0A218WPE8_PUNGR|nr:hypothetical protein CDL15_Pgr009284 [Punica granatum]